jgi:twitching motility protein PilI
MAKREALRELQSRLAERMQAARTQERVLSWLAVESAGRGFLFPLQQAGEIFVAVPLLGVPHTQDWFLGVANLRGGLHGVVDLASFLGVKAPSSAAAPTREQSRLIAFNPNLNVNCALLVDRLAGLRSVQQLSAAEADGRPRPPFVGGSWLDGDGRAWQEIRLAELAADPQFLSIVG